MNFLILLCNLPKTDWLCTIDLCYQVVHFRSIEKPKEDDFCLEM